MIRKVIVGLLLVVLLAVVVGAGGIAWITLRAHPQTTGSLQVPGLQDQVTIERDASGIAQITASTPRDLFMAQGYVHAQERMWQMEVWRRITSGRLAEVFGKGSLDTDRFIRTLGWRQAAERDLAALSSETRSVLEAYAAGVNAWLDANRNNLGMAFIVTGDKPEPWSVLDTLAFEKLQAWNLGGNMDAELFRFFADQRLVDPALTDSLFPTREFGPVIVPAPDAEEPPAADVVDGGDPRARTAARPALSRDPGGGLAERCRARRSCPRPRRLRFDRGRRARLRPRHRLERLGGRPEPVDEWRGAAGQRSTPRDLDAVGLVHQRPALPRGH